MKKICNFRPMFLLAVLFMIATAVATFFAVSIKSKLIVFFIIYGLLIITILLTLTFKRKFLIFISVALLFIAFPFISMAKSGYTLNKNLVYAGKDVNVYGKISGNYKFTTTGNLEILLDDIKVDDRKLNGKVAIYTKPENMDLSKLNIGRYISVETTLSWFTLEKDLSRSLSFLNRNIVASGFALFYKFDFTDRVSSSIKDKICSNVFEILDNGDVKYSEVGYAMLFGDTNVLDTNLNSSFRSTGIAHLLAVSGLNVSIIVLLFNFLLKKLKVSYKFNFIVSFIFLSLYCYLCNFSPSVVRASLMAMFSLYATIRGKAYDNLSVLSLIAILVMLISPIEMFNISFVLSFSAVLSIILLASIQTRILDKVFYNKLSGSLSLNIAVQVGLFVTNLFYFGKYPVLGIIANIIAVPIATTAFMFLIIGVLTTGVFPFMNIFNKVFGYLMEVVVKFNNWIASIGFDFRAGGISVIAIMLMFAFMYIVSDYVFVKKRTKVMISSIILSTVAILFLL